MEKNTAVVDHPGTDWESSDHALSENAAMGRTLTRDVNPIPAAWPIFALGALVPIGMSAAAAAVSYLTTNERVAMTAWISVAVVGASSVISAGVASQHRHIIRSEKRSRPAKPD